MRTRPGYLVLAALLAGAAGAGGALALGPGPGAGAGTAGGGTGTAGPGTIVTVPSGPPGSIGPPAGPPAEQTHPAALPRTGGPRTRFAVRLTLADAPGHAGVLATGYRLDLTPPARHAAARCSPAAPATIDAGVAHQVVRVGLTRPAGGWCTGRYTVFVLLQRGPYCPRPAPGAPPTPCPAFAEREVNVGTTHFTVAARH